jgi:hypothetical protein
MSTGAVGCAERYRQTASSSRWFLGKFEPLLTAACAESEGSCHSHTRVRKILGLHARAWFGSPRASLGAARSALPKAGRWPSSASVATFGKRPVQPSRKPAFRITTPPPCRPDVAFDRRLPKNSGSTLDRSHPCARAGTPRRVAERPVRQPFPDQPRLPRVHSMVPPTNSACRSTNATVSRKARPPSIPPLRGRRRSSTTKICAVATLGRRGRSEFEMRRVSSPGDFPVASLSQAGRGLTFAGVYHRFNA